VIKHLHGVRPQNSCGVWQTGTFAAPLPQGFALSPPEHTLAWCQATKLLRSLANGDVCRSSSASFALSLLVIKHLHGVSPQNSCGVWQTGTFAAPLSLFSAPLSLFSALLFLFPAPQEQQTSHPKQEQQTSPFAKARRALLFSSALR